ncbi:hypothetical protein GCM10010285_44510 [Streptomyces pseudogriseolus]|uniref:Uncharacterized protein n=1 Tax=Streptomyces pseudogriseolus TaxID=36817 RepID=A0ABQ2TD50_STREZ|nr:hypothetical protein GCM10010285_44510 [Streptomyces rubiginosus]
MFALTPHRPQTFKLSTDPPFIDRVRDVVGLSLGPPQASVAAVAASAIAASRAAVCRRHDPVVGVEPDGLDRQPGPPDQVTDREERVSVHACALSSPSTGDSTPLSPLSRRTTGPDNYSQPDR